MSEVFTVSGEHVRYEREREEGLSETRKCPECRGLLLIRDRERAEVACANCGFVLASKLTDRGPEWRTFTLEQKAQRMRVGPPFTFAIHDKGLTTKIDGRDRDIYGRSLSPRSRAQFHRLRRWQHRIQVSDRIERNLSIALSIMYKVGDQLNLPKNVLETAALIHRRAVKKGLVKGRPIQAVTAAAIYMACRECKLARTLDEVAEATQTERKELGRSYRLLVRELNHSVPLTRPEIYITKFSNELELHGKGEEVAYKVLKAARKLKLMSGRGPVGIAAAATYMASILMGKRLTQREIAEVAQVTEVTIRNRYKSLVEQLLLVISI